MLYAITTLALVAAVVVFSLAVCWHSPRCQSWWCARQLAWRAWRGLEDAADHGMNEVRESHHVRRALTYIEAVTEDLAMSMGGDDRLAR